MEYLLNKRITALALASLMILGMAYTAKSAYAHSFSGDESAEFLAKVQELKVETHLIQQNLSNQTIVAWHSDKISEFWNANDTKEMTERNKRLGTEIPALISNITAAANSTNPDATKIGQLVTSLDNSLAEAVTVRIDQTARNNATVNALAIVNVLDETMEDYGIATGAEEEEESGGNMSMSEGGNMSDNMSGSSSSNETTTTIVNVAAHQTAQGLAAAAQTMFSDLKAKAPANATDSISKLDKGFVDLKQAIDGKASNDDVTAIVHGTLMANMQTAFNLQVVPEFPLPLLLTIPAIAGIIAATRITALRER
jgi:hypothetical protein